MVIIKYAFHPLLIHILLIISWYDDENNFFASAEGYSLVHIRERIVGFLMMEAINSRGEFHYSRSGGRSLIKDFVLDLVHSLSLTFGCELG
jgi:hypothetical protein